MAMKLMYITNNTDVATIADKYGVDWIVVDLEYMGKKERQAGLDTVLSRHQISDIPKVKNVLVNSKLLVRVNPIHLNSKQEIDDVIDAGAEIVMLPYFKTVEEVDHFIYLVDNRAEVLLLLETPEAVELIDEILEVEGIDYIHVGLNDLHIGYKMTFMFELLADGTVERIANKVVAKKIVFGFGGIARIGDGLLPAENILAEHFRLNSKMVILSRSFCNTDAIKNLEEIEEKFISGVASIRIYEQLLKNASVNYLNFNQKNIVNIVNEISGIAHPA